MQGNPMKLWRQGVDVRHAPGSSSCCDRRGSSRPPSRDSSATTTNIPTQAQDHVTSHRQSNRSFTTIVHVFRHINRHSQCVGTLVWHYNKSMHSLTHNPKPMTMTKYATSIPISAPSSLVSPTYSDMLRSIHVQKLTVENYSFPICKTLQTKPIGKVSHFTSLF